MKEFPFKLVQNITCWRSSLCCIQLFIIHLFVTPSSIMSQIQSKSFLLNFFLSNSRCQSELLLIVTLCTGQARRENAKQDCKFVVSVSIHYALVSPNPVPSKSYDNELHITAVDQGTNTLDNCICYVYFIQLLLKTSV